MENLYRLSVTKLVGLQHRWLRRTARYETVREMPQLLRAYKAFEVAQQSGSKRQPFKGWDVWQQLVRFKPMHIVELGSGTTSAVFALWRQRTDAKYVCFEHHPAWAEVTERCLREANLITGASPVQVVPARDDPHRGTTGFAQDIPNAADFIYVDGPPTRLPNGKKVGGDDVYRLLDTGARPAAIVVDGRSETVDLIRSHPAAANYLFEPGYVHAMRNGMWQQALQGREHSIFSRRNA
jgi:hypothetical protein